MTTRLQWWPASLWLVTCGLFLAFSHWLGPGLVYAKLQSDSAVYLVQAQHLWLSGSAWNFSLAPSLPAVVYTPVPAWLRAVMFGITTDPAVLVRLVQVQNLVVLTLLAWVSHRYLLCRLQGGNARAWSMVPLFYLPLTYNPWVLNAFLPMGDHLFALLTMGALWLSVMPPAVEPGKRAARQVLALSLVALAAIQKLTGLALLAIVVLRNRRRGDLLWMLPASALVLWIALGLYGDVHVQAFAAGAGHYLHGRSAASVVMDTGINLVVAAVPNQIIPNFSYLMNREFTGTHAVGTSAMTVANLPWIAAGLAISGLVLSGAWRERRRLAPELLLLAATVPVYAMASNSTSRYLASVQPVFWILVLAGGAPLWKRLQPSRGTVVALAAAAALVVGANMSANIARSFSGQHGARWSELLPFLRDLSGTFERGQQRVVALARASADARFVLLADDIRWQAIASVRFVAAQDAGAAVCQGAPVYAVHACDARNCVRLARDEQSGRDRLLSQGLTPTPVYAAQSAAATFQIQRWQRLPDQPCMPN